MRDAFEQIQDFLIDACLIYPLVEIRNLERDGKVKPATLTGTMPLPRDSFRTAVYSNADFFRELHGDRRHNCHLSIMKILGEARGDDDEGAGADEEANLAGGGGEYVVFADQDQESKLVYAIRLDHVEKKIVVVFRGSVTYYDWQADATAIQKPIKSPVVQGEGEERKKLPSKVTVHKGFFDYLITEGKYQEILSHIKQLLTQHPNYKVCTTGHSLGGALCTLFSFYAASEPGLPKPVICVSFASPKIGAMTFRNALKHLEDQGDLRCVRVANDQDPVTAVPRDVFMVLPPDLCCAFLFLFFTQPNVFRHVGMGLKLYYHDDNPPQIFHAKDYNYCRTLFSDWTKVVVRVYYCLCCQIPCCLAGKTRYRENHGYPEYWRRLHENEASIRSVKKIEDLYNDFYGERKVVAARYW